MIIFNEEKPLKKEHTATLFADYPDLMSVEQLSSMLNISTKTAYKLLKENQIQSIHVGRHYKIPKIYVLKYLGLIK